MRKIRKVPSKLPYVLPRNSQFLSARSRRAATIPSRNEKRSGEKVDHLTNETEHCGCDGSGKTYDGQGIAEYCSCWNPEQETCEDCGHIGTYCDCFDED